MSICKKCGNQMPDTAKFCGVCGTPLEEVNVTGAAPVASVEGTVEATTGAAETANAATTTEAATEATETVAEKAATATETATNETATAAETATVGMAGAATAGAAQQFGNGTQQFGNGTQQFGNGAQQFGNGAQQFGNGTQQFGNGAQQFGNGTQQFGNGTQQFGNAAQQFGNAAQQFQQKEPSSTYFSKQAYTAPADDATANKGVAICAYFGLLWLVPLFTAKHSPFAKFHTNQAIIITIITAIVKIVLTVLGWLMSRISWKLFWVPTAFSTVSAIFALALMIWGIVYAAQGKMKDIPGIGQIRILK